MTEKRRQKFIRVANRRQTDVAVLLENVADNHNIGAVMRTCDAVGIPSLYILNTLDEIQFKNLRLGKRTTSGSRKWIEVKYFTDREKCFEELKVNYDHIFATHLSSDAISIHKADFNQSSVLVFGNEKEGISDESLALCDSNILIPMMGMVQSLNISVACAVSLYELLRQRDNSKRYDNADAQPSGEKLAIFERYLDRHAKPGHNKRIDVE